MSTWTTQTTCPGTPDDVLELLTQPDAIARWSPLPFSVAGLHPGRLRAGDRVRVGGEFAGRSMEFVVRVAQASEGRLALTASGPIEIEVEYLVARAPQGSSVKASIGVAGRGLVGRMLARATDALLAAGALRAALDRIGRELELPDFATGELERALAA
jgi:Polyketide cyclase / dehydrase and lipid transport